MAGEAAGDGWGAALRDSVRCCTCSARKDFLAQALVLSREVEHDLSEAARGTREKDLSHTQGIMSDGAYSFPTLDWVAVRAAHAF